jgi:hypothetical protein
VDKDQKRYWIKNNNSPFLKIPPNLPFIKGGVWRKKAFDSPLRKRGAGGDFHASRVPATKIGILKISQFIDYVFLSPVSAKI